MILRLKYMIVRLIEKIPFIQILIYNFISNFHFFFPHEKDYYGLKKLINIENKNHFIDVGGNIGLSIIGFRQLGFKNKIIVFEPDVNFCIKKLIKLKKKISNIKLYKFGLSDKNEVKKFYQAYFFGIKMHFLSSFDKSYLLNSINEGYRFFKFFFVIKTQNLILKRFDKLILNTNPVFIKIDVEGFDHKVINGMIRTIKRYKPILLVELNKENFNEIYKTLSFGYEPYTFDYLKSKFNKIKKKEIIKITKNSNRKLNLSSSRNVYFIPKIKSFNGV